MIIKVEIHHIHARTYHTNTLVQYGLCTALNNLHGIESISQNKYSIFIRIGQMFDFDSLDSKILTLIRQYEDKKEIK